MFVNIREYLAEGDNDKVGEPELLRIISEFHALRIRMLNIF